MRLLLIPLLCYALSALVVLVVGPSVAVPASFDACVAWLQEYEGWLWAPAMALIASDSFFVMPSDPARIALGIVYGPLLGGALAGIATVSSGLAAFAATRALAAATTYALVSAALVWVGRRLALHPAMSFPARGSGTLREEG